MIHTSTNYGWLLADIFLVGLNIFHFFVLFSHLHHVASPLKKIALRILHNVVEPIHATPFLTSAFLMVLVTLCGKSAMAYYKDTDDVAMLVRAIVSFYTTFCARIFMKLSDTMIKFGVDKTLELERELERHDIVNFEPPSLAMTSTIMAPMKPFLQVDVTGIDRIPQDKPHLFVMNHSLLGIEMPFFIQTLYKEKNIFVRGLADNIHYATPNGSILTKFGAVSGTRDNCNTLMANKQNVLVYPGGGHEVLKHSSVPRYTLLWKERLGFVRLAIKHGYPILPCAAVGTEDMLETILDIPVEFVRKGLSIPVAIVSSPTKVQKIYFWFGDPIPTEQYKGDWENTEFAKQVRDQTKAAVEGGIEELLQRQANDPDRYLCDQYTKSFKKAFSGAYDTFCSSLVTSDDSINGNVHFENNVVLCDYRSN